MSEARRFLKKNLLELMEKSPDLHSQAALSRRSEVSIGTINGILIDEELEASEPRIDIVEKLAQAFGFAAWQLLHPSLKVSLQEAKLYATFRSLMDGSPK